MKLKLYGSKGSIPLYSKRCIKTGGNTACLRVDINGETVLFDCGSGIMEYAAEIKDEQSASFDICLSHLHVDHIIGLITFAPMFDPSSKIRLFTSSRGDTSLKNQVFGIFKPPYWPIDLEKIMNCECVEIEPSVPFEVRGGVKVTPMTGEHPDETLSFRVDHNGKRLVYLLDYEISYDNGSYENLVEYCRDADCIVFDSCYLPDDYPPRVNWGHSTHLSGIKLAKDCGCKKLVLAHFYQAYTDEMLADLQIEVSAQPFECVVSYDGYEWEI